MHGNQVGVQEEGEADLYEDLSEFIRIFKRVLGLADSATSLLLRQQDCLPPLALLRQTLADHRPLLAAYNFVLPDPDPHRKYLRPHAAPTSVSSAD